MTDLIADDTKKGTVKHLRHIETHFLSAQETILAAHFQNQNPNICKLSSNGRFGSKFVTVVVSGMYCVILVVQSKHNGTRDGSL